MNHVRGNSTLLLFTVVTCCVLYPVALLTVGSIGLASLSSGSLVDKTGKLTSESASGSMLIAQPFTDNEYFWPRPSAASYNATASGGTNWGANNPKLRDRVSQQLGPMVQYKKGSPSAGSSPQARTPQQDIEAWFAAVPDRVSSWAAESSLGPVNWAKADALHGEYILAWAKDHPEVTEEWKKANPESEANPEELVVPFFASFAKANPGKWPGIVSVEEGGQSIKRVEPVSSDAAIHSNFFDLWISDPANKSKAEDLVRVPADMVTASASGLDPHITLRNALSVYQLDRVAQSRTKPNEDIEKTKTDIAKLVQAHSFVPLSGLVGEPLVNVLEVNIELDKAYPTTKIAP